jgi:dTDP-4-dehydrorhamnose reductase
MTSGCRVLVIGREGQFARELVRAKWPTGWSATCTGRPGIDLRLPDQAAAAVAAAAPDIVVNAAAYTNVDRAESEPDLALLVNAAGPAAVARACATIGAPFLTLSTDYVFDGKKAGPYSEADTVNPVSAYGRSKAEGEARVRSALPEHVILRTSWLFSPFGTNFVRTMMRLGSERSVVRVVADQHGSPTGAGDLARVIVALCEAIKSGKGRFGTFHAANAGATTWYDIARAIFDGLAARNERVPQVVPITTAEYGAKAERPANSVLDCSRLKSSFDVTIRPWRPALDDCVNELIEQKWHKQAAGSGTAS